MGHPHGHGLLWPSRQWTNAGHSPLHRQDGKREGFPLAPLSPYFPQSLRVHILSYCSSLDTHPYHTCKASCECGCLAFLCLCFGSGLPQQGKVVPTHPVHTVLLQSCYFSEHLHELYRVRMLTPHLSLCGQYRSTVYLPFHFIHGNFCLFCFSGTKQTQ